MFLLSGKLCFFYYIQDPNFTLGGMLLRGLTHESSKVRPGFVGTQSTRVIMGEAQDYPTFMWGPRKIGPNPKSGLQCGLEVEFTSVIFFCGEIGLAVFKIILYFPTKIHFLGQPKNYRFFLFQLKPFMFWWAHTKILAMFFFWHHVAAKIIGDIQKKMIKFLLRYFSFRW